MRISTKEISYKTIEIREGSKVVESQGEWYLVQDNCTYHLVIDKIFKVQTKFELTKKTVLRAGSIQYILKLK